MERLKTTSSSTEASVYMHSGYTSLYPHYVMKVMNSLPSYFQSTAPGLFGTPSTCVSCVKHTRLSSPSSNSAEKSYLQQFPPPALIHECEALKDEKETDIPSPRNKKRKIPPTSKLHLVLQNKALLNIFLSI